VVLHRLERGRVEATVANTRAGTVEAYHRARMSPSVGGKVAELPVKQCPDLCRRGAGNQLPARWWCRCADDYDNRG